MSASHLVMPLLRLTPPPVDVTGRIDSAPAPRTLDLHAPDPGLVAWAARVREASEPMLLLDAGGRLAALSRPAGRLLSLDPAATVGALLLDLLELVDFSASAVQITDPEHQMPVLRALVTGGLARGLVRVRSATGLTTFDVVGVPLAGRAGALGFFSEV